MLQLVPPCWPIGAPADEPVEVPAVRIPSVLALQTGLESAVPLKEPVSRNTRSPEGVRKDGVRNGLRGEPSVTALKRRIERLSNNLVLMGKPIIVKARDYHNKRLERGDT